MKNFFSTFKYVIALLIVAAVIIFSISYIFKHKESVKKQQAGSRADYEVVTAVPGVVFEINEELSDYATGVTEVSKNVDFVKNATYSYQNNNNIYMQFNMAKFIVIACKGTSFDFKNKEVLESLDTNSLNGIWFTNPKNVSETDSKITMDVEAQVIITNTVYNEFSGKLCTIINSDGTEWSLFVGCVDSKDENMHDMIEYVSETFSLNMDNVVVERDTYEVTFEEEEKPSLRVIEAKVPETFSAPVIAFTDIFEKEDVSGGDYPIEESEAALEENASAMNDGTEDKEENELVFHGETFEEENGSAEEETEKVSMLSAPSNQKEFIKDEDKAYTSSVYSMLGIGDTAFFENKDEKVENFTEVYVKVTAYYGEKEANELIEKYIDSGSSYYKEMKAPAGTHWEAIEYDVKCPANMEAIINTRIVGLDGNDLVHRGVKYTKRTYNITNLTKEVNGWIKGYIAFYAVPTSCLEYAIAFGEQILEESYGAYYYITRGNE